MHINGAIIFLFVIIFCVGAAAGGLIERALKRGRSDPPPPPMPLPPTPLPPPDSEKNTLADAEDVEVLTAWRTSSNQVWLGMDGMRMNDKTALKPGQYQRLLALVLDLRPWLETTRPIAPKPEPTQPPLHPAEPVAAVVTQAPVQARPTQKKNTPQVDEKAEPAPVLDSIIQQIDKVLQEKLATSAFKERGIELVEGPGGIVIVKDGVNNYEGLDAVPDPEVKAFIRQAVADWEKGSK
jgi:hypothetical protein